MKRALLILLLAAAAHAQVPTPSKFVGFEVGADRKLADYRQIVSYFRAVAAASPRVKIESLGKTTLGEDFIMAIVSSEANVRNLERIRDAATKLADPRGLSDAQVDALVRDGKSVVLVTCNIHSSEIASSQMAMEWLHALATASDAETKRRLDNVVLLLVPSLNPDGQIMITDYYRKYLGTQYEGGRLPWLITGLGMVTPLGCGVEPTWKRLLRGESGAGKIDSFDVSDIACKIACEIPRGDGSNATFNPDQWMEPKEQRKVDEFILFAMCAARQALDDAGWRPTSYDEQTTTGVLIGSGIGGIEGIAEAAIQLHEKGPRRVSPFFIPGRIINLASGFVSIAFGLKGPNHAVVTACSTGAHAIGDAARMVALGDADVMVAGGAESPVNRISLAGFSALRALSTNFNDDPTRASRPYDKDRDGFVMGEGAGVVVLEALDHAKARGAKIYAELIGYGLSGDAHHITAPAPDGDGALRCMKGAIRTAGISTGDIDYINAHGTSTPLGDEIELGAVQKLVGNAAGRMSMSSTKSCIGHLLGAAGAVEAIFSILTIRDRVVPPTINLDNPSVDTPIDLVPHQARKRDVDTALSNSFGFGGTNASLIFRRYAA